VLDSRISGGKGWQFPFFECVTDSTQESRGKWARAKMLMASLTPRAGLPARDFASLRTRARSPLASAGARIVSAPRSVADSRFHPRKSRFPRDGRARVVVVSANAASAPGAPLQPPPVSAHVFQLAAAVAAPAPPATPKMQLGVKILLGGLATILLAVFTACIAGFLVAVREMVRACREATIASRSVANACESVSQACIALKETLVPTSASRTLMEAITRQYGDSPDGTAPNKRGGAAMVGGVMVNIGDVIKGERVGARWIGGSRGCNFEFDRSNRFRVGEYCAVPRNDQTYTWGVIELNDDDYSMEKSSDSLDDEAGLSCDWPPQESAGDPALSCDWPPRDIDAIPTTAAVSSSYDDGDSADAAKATVGLSGWFERGVVAVLGPKRAYTAEGYLRNVTGLTTVEEREYKVVVELDTSVYSFKIMNAGDLGKRSASE
jgi:hypothetical protein